MLKLGVIGTNWITKQFVEAVHLSQRYQLTTVYSRQVATGEQFVNELNLTHPVTVVDELVQLLNPDIDVLYIASPNSLHAQQAIAAIEKDIHVIIEKPIVSNPNELAAIEQAMRAHSQVLVMEAARHVYTPNFQVATQAVKQFDGIQGATLYFQKYSSRFDDYLAGKEPNVLTRQFSAGALYDLGVYPIYAAVKWFGKPTDAVYYPQLLANGADGSGTAILVYPEFNVTIHTGKNSTTYQASEVYSLKETLVIDSIAELGQIQIHHADGQVDELTQAVPENSMLPEAVQFADWIEQDDPNAADYQAAWQTIRDVNATLYQARQSAKIEFPADQN